jgi:hypothetical protein
LQDLESVLNSASAATAAQQSLHSETFKEFVERYFVDFNAYGGADSNLKASVRYIKVVDLGNASRRVTCGVRRMAL